MKIKCLVKNQPRNSPILTQSGASHNLQSLCSSKEISLLSPVSSPMDVEKSNPAVDDELEKVLFSGREYTKPGAMIGNCLFLFGSNEGDCSLCTKPCLHPLASQDLIAFFHVAALWMDYAIE